jgi:hypothetical protein
MRWTNWIPISSSAYKPYDYEELTVDMKYREKTVVSDPGMAQEEALLSLQRSSSFKAGTQIQSFRRRGASWVATLLEPKTAGEPPAFEDKEEGPSDGPPSDGPPSDGPPEEDGPPGDDEGLDLPVTDDPSDEDSKDPAISDEGGEKPKGKGGEEKKEVGIDEQILHTLQQLLHAIQGGGAPDGMGGPDALGPGPDGPAAPPAPKHGPPGGGPPGMGGPPMPPKPPAGRPMKPGEAPPGSTPVGAPAFASTKQAMDPMGGGMAQAPVPQAQGAGGNPAQQGGTCPECGYPEPCPMHSGQNQGAGIAPPGMGMNPLAAAVQAKKGSPTITLKAPAGQYARVSDAVKAARPAVEAHGYKIKQAKVRDGKIVILASVR